MVSTSSWADKLAHSIREPWPSWHLYAPAGGRSGRTL